MNALGIHLLIEMQECDPVLLDDIQHVRKVMLTAASETGVTILGDTFHRFSPQGITGVIAIAESHLSVHTWPEYKYAAADIFTCGTSFDPYVAANVLIKQLGCKRPNIIEVRRGLIPGSQVTHKPAWLMASKG